MIEGRAHTRVIDDHGTPFAVAQDATVPGELAYGFGLEAGMPNFRHYP